MSYVRETWETCLWKEFIMYKVKPVIRYCIKQPSNVAVKFIICTKKIFYTTKISLVACIVT